MKLRRKRDVQPGARFIIETDTGKFARDSITGISVQTKPPKLEMFTAFQEIQVVQRLDSPSTATITLVSPNDNLKSSLARQRARNDVSVEFLALQQDVAKYLEDCLSVSEVRELNRQRRAGIWDVAVQSKKWVQEQLNGWISPSTPYAANRTAEYSEFEFFNSNFALMRRMWIDFLDHDGEWVAGFTGFVSAVTDTFSTSNPFPTFTITGKGMSRLFQISEVVKDGSLDDRTAALLSDPITQPGTLTNRLAGMGAEDIIIMAAKNTNESLSFLGELRQTILFGGTGPTEGNVGWLAPDSKFGADDHKNPADFFYQYPILDTSGYTSLSDPSLAGKIAIAMGAGTDAQRNFLLDQAIGTIRNPSPFGADFVAIKPWRTFDPANTTTTDLTGKLIIDPRVTSNEKAFQVYRRQLASAFQMFQPDRVPSWALCREVANILSFDFFDDPKGNIVFQPPRYDDLPRLVDDAPLKHLDPQNQNSYGRLYSTLPYHDRRYVIDDASLEGWQMVESEEALISYGEVTGMPDLLTTPNSDILEMGNKGRTNEQTMGSLGAEFRYNFRHLVRRFGLRRAVFPNLIVGTFGQDQKMLAKFAYAQMARVNASGKTTTVSLHQRPDLWPGRTVFLVERQTLGYIVGTTNTFRPKTPHSTTLTLAYCHDPSLPVGVPAMVANNDDSAAAPSTMGIY